MFSLSYEWVLRISYAVYATIFFLMPSFSPPGLVFGLPVAPEFARSPEASHAHRLCA